MNRIAYALVALVVVSGCRKEEEIKSEPGAPEPAAAAPLPATAPKGKLEEVAKKQVAAPVRVTQTHVTAGNTVVAATPAADGKTRVIRAEDGRQIRTTGDRVEVRAPDGRRVTIGPNGVVAEDLARGARVGAHGGGVHVATTED